MKKKFDIFGFFRIILLIVSCVLLFWSCYMIYTTLVEYNEGENIYNNIRDDIKNETITGGFKVPENLPTVSENTEESTDDTEEELSESEEKQEFDILAYLATIDMSKYERQGSVEGKPGMPLIDLIAKRYNLVDFNKLFEINSDVVGWITIEGTVVDYPMVQGDDNEYYLRKTITHEFNMAGTIFVDYRIQNPFNCENTIIHGHNQKNNAMFHDLAYFIDKNYFDEHKYIYIYLPNGRCETYEIYSFYQAESRSFAYDCSYLGNEYQEYLNNTIKYSMYPVDISLTTMDKIITLSTCTNIGGNERYIVHAKRIA